MNTRVNTLVSFFALALSLGACSKSAAPTSTEVDATESRDDLATRAGAPLFDGMGSYHHAITTSDPDAQRYFNQGLIIDLRFNEKCPG